MHFLATQIYFYMRCVKFLREMKVFVFKTKAFAGVTANYFKWKGNTYIIERKGNAYIIQWTPASAHTLLPSPGIQEDSSLKQDSCMLWTDFQRNFCLTIYHYFQCDVDFTFKGWIECFGTRVSHIYFLGLCDTAEICHLISLKSDGYICPITSHKEVIVWEL